MRNYSKFLNVNIPQCLSLVRLSSKPPPSSTNPPCPASSASARAAPKVKLPKLPVPQLHDTLQKYLRSARPFLTCEEYCRSEAIVRDFGAPGQLGETLQECLHCRAEQSDNWLEEMWLNTAYLGFRSPVVVYSSPAQVFPRQTFNCEEDFLMCAAKVAFSAIQYKLHIDSGGVELEKSGADPLDMGQYYKVFGTNRVPCCPLDTISFNPNSKHIVVAHNNHFFKFSALNDEGKPWEIADWFFRVEEAVKASSCLAPPVGILTTEHRNTWSMTYKNLLQDDRTAASVKDIEDSLFLLCLDRVCPQPCVNNMSTTALQVLHGGGPTANSGNRWFDKTIQFIISRDGGLGIAYEHSPAEGGVIANMMDYILPTLEKKISYKDPTCPIKLEELPFNLNDSIKVAIAEAQCNINDLVNNLELCCFSFNSFGKDCIKGLRASPDSFIQLAIQLAFFRLHLTPGAQYETGSLRRFSGGRTETIRTCSEESIMFVQAMLSECLSPQHKANALRLALYTHQRYVQDAMNMRAVDRHLLGLRLIAEENNYGKPDLYSDAAFERSTHFRISTSQVPSKGDGFMCYGPITEDGYSCCYNPRDNNINFGIATFASCPETNPCSFRDSLDASLEEMKCVLTQAPTSKL